MKRDSNYRSNFNFQRLGSVLIRFNLTELITSKYIYELGGVRCDFIIKSIFSLKIKKIPKQKE